MGIDADPFEQVRELSEQLALQSQRYLELCLRLERLTDVSNRLFTEVSVLCEAYLAGDHLLVLQQLAPLAKRYQANNTANVIIH